MGVYHELRDRAERLLEVLQGIEKGRAALDGRDFETALAHFHRVLELEPENTEIRTLLDKAARGKVRQEQWETVVTTGRRWAFYVVLAGLAGFLVYMAVISWVPAAYEQIMGVYGPTSTPTATPTHTPTSTPTATATPTSTFTPTATPTATATPTSTSTPTWTPTPTPTHTPTVTPTPTPTPIIVIMTGNVRVYALPDPELETNPIAYLEVRTIVRVLAVQGGWVKVKTENYEGWVPMQWVGFTAPVPPEIVTPAPPTRTPTAIPTATETPQE